MHYGVKKMLNPKSWVTGVPSGVRGLKLKNEPPTALKTT
jgi:hypothetical protein